MSTADVPSAIPASSIARSVLAIVAACLGLMPAADGSYAVVVDSVLAIVQDEFATWPLGLLGAVGGSVGEVVAISGALTQKDDEAFAAAWIAAAERAESEAVEAERQGHLELARGQHLRATQYYEVAIHTWYGRPVAQRLVHAFDRLTHAFDRTMALEVPPCEPLTIPFDGHAMPGYFLPAADADKGGSRPVVILVNGYDATMADMYLGMAVTHRSAVNTIRGSTPR